MATAEMLELMTAEQFGRRPDPGHPEELVRGRIVAMSVPDRRHGYVCCTSGAIFRAFVLERDLGRVMTNDSGVITERNPDTVRGADVAYYSYARLPKGPLPAGYGPEVPELVVEVCSSAIAGVKCLKKCPNTSALGSRSSSSLTPGHSRACLRRGRPSQDPRPRR